MPIEAAAAEVCPQETIFPKADAALEAGFAGLGARVLHGDSGGEAIRQCRDLTQFCRRRGQAARERAHTAISLRLESARESRISCRSVTPGLRFRGILGTSLPTLLLAAALLPFDCQGIVPFNQQAARCAPLAARLRRKAWAAQGKPLSRLGAFCPPTAVSFEPSACINFFLPGWGT